MAAHSNEIIINRFDNKVSRKKTTDSGVVYLEKRQAQNFIQQVSNRSFFDTGFLPPGVLSVRQYGGHLQIAIIAPPSKNLVIWGDSEGSLDAETYLLAQPYRVMIGEFKEGAFLGARMFYSPNPITSSNDILYHANVPNLNCRGYRGTAVGWVCLYQSHDTTGMNIAQKAAYIGLRCSGNEAYNDNNMAETDGPRFYEAYSYPSYTYNPQLWESKTESEGIEWTLDSKVWIPVLVQGLESQDAQYDRGVPLTLGMALDGPASYYYYDDGKRLWNQDPDHVSVFDEVFNSAFNLATFVSSKEISVPKAYEPFELPHGVSFGLNEDSSSPQEDLITIVGDIVLSSSFVNDTLNSKSRSSVLALASFEDAGFNYTISDVLEIGFSDSQMAVVTYVHRDGLIVGCYQPATKEHMGVIDGNPNKKIIRLCRASALSEYMALNRETIWNQYPYVVLSPDAITADFGTQDSPHLPLSRFYPCMVSSPVSSVLSDKGVHLVPGMSLADLIRNLHEENCDYEQEEYEEENF